MTFVVYSTTASGSGIWSCGAECAAIYPAAICPSLMDLRIAFNSDMDRLVRSIDIMFF